MKIQLLERDGDWARYLVLDEAGHEIKQVGRDVSQEIALAKRQRKSLIRLIAQSEGAREVVRELPEADIALSGIPLDNTHYHEPPEHDHVLPEHGHPETADLAQVLAKDKAATDREIGYLQIDVANLSKPFVLPQHEHEMPAHGDNVRDGRLDALEAGVRALQLQAHPEHQHNFASTNDIAALQGQIEALKGQLADVASDPNLSALRSDFTNHGHHGLEEAVADVAELKQQIAQVQIAKPKAKVDPKRLLALHNWHIAGQETVHGVLLVEYECDCGARIFAPEGVIK